MEGMDRRDTPGVRERTAGGADRPSHPHGRGGLYQLVVQCFEARGIRRQPRSKTVVLQGNFCEWVQETEGSTWGSGARAVDPLWRDGTSLRWSLDGDTLKAVRATSPFLRLTAYARPRAASNAPPSAVVPTSTGADEALGYVVIDLRAAELTLGPIANPPAWHRLLGRGAQGEIRLATRLVAVRGKDEDSYVPADTPEGDAGPRDAEGGYGASPPTTDAEGGTRALADAVRVVDPSEPLPTEPSAALVAPVDANYIPIGPSAHDDGADYFTLSVSVIALHRPSALFGALSGEFWLSFKLFGILVQTDTFSDLTAPLFASIRDSFRLRGAVEDIASFLADMPPLQVYLCSAGTAHGVAVIPMHSLLPPEAVEQLTRARGSARGRQSTSPGEEKKDDDEKPPLADVQVTGGFPLQPLHPPELASEWAALVEEDASGAVARASSLEAVVTLQQEDTAAVEAADRETAASRAAAAAKAARKRDAEIRRSREQREQAERAERRRAAAAEREAEAAREAELRSSLRAEDDAREAAAEARRQREEADEAAREEARRQRAQEKAEKDAAAAAAREAEREARAAAAREPERESEAEASRADDRGTPSPAADAQQADERDSPRGEEDSTAAPRAGRGEEGAVDASREVVASDDDDREVVPPPTRSAEPVIPSSSTRPPLDPNRSSAAGGAGGASKQPSAGHAASRASASSKASTRESPSSKPRHTKVEHEDAVGGEWEDDNTPIHVRFSVDLRSVRQITEPSNLYARYTYPAFGRKSAVRSRPPVYVARHAERLLPGGFCLFEFAMGRSDLRRTLRTVPLAVELWQQDRYAEDRLLGVATVDLGKILKSPVFKRHASETYTRAPAPGGAGAAAASAADATASKQEPERMVLMQAHDGYFTVARFEDEDDPESRYVKNGSLRCVLYLENLGKLDDDDTDTSRLRLLDAAEADDADARAEAAAGEGDSQAARQVLRASMERMREERASRESGLRASHATSRDGDEAPSGSGAPPAEGGGGGATGTSAAGGGSGGGPAGSGGGGGGTGRASGGGFLGGGGFIRGGGGNGSRGGGGGGDDPGRGGGGGAGGPAGAVDAKAMEALKAQNEERLREAVAAAIAREQRRFAQWREDQVAAFRVALKDKEASRMAELEAAWLEREKARSAELAAQQAEYNKLEAKLRKALAEAENRERQLVAAQEDNTRKAAHKMADVTVLQRRLREEAEHQVGIERHRCEALERQLRDAETAIAAANARVRDVEAEFDEFRAQRRNSPESKLREEIQALRLERAEMEKRLEAAHAETRAEKAARDKCRVQLLRLARELQRMRAAERRRAATDLQKLRVEYLAREERYVLDGDRATLRDIRRELDGLRFASDAPSTAGDADSPHGDGAAAAEPPPPPPAAAGGDSEAGAGAGAKGGERGAPGGSGSAPQAADAAAAAAALSSDELDELQTAEREANRLKDERWKLMRTGAYTASSAIVKALDERIAAAEQRRRELLKE